MRKEVTAARLGLKPGDYAVVVGMIGSHRDPPELVQIGETYQPGSLEIERRIKVRRVSDGDRTDYDAGCTIYRRPGLVTRLMIKVGLVS